MKTKPAPFARLAGFALLPLLLALPVSVEGALFCRGGLASNAWDINTTTNWLNGTTASVYSDGSAVTFDNSVTRRSSVHPTSPGSPRIWDQ